MIHHVFVLVNSNVLSVIHFHERYKALQEDLIHKINSLETTLTEQKEELDMTNHELKELIRDKDDIIAHKEHVNFDTHDSKYIRMLCLMML